MAVLPMTDIGMFATRGQRTRHEQHRQLRELRAVVRLREPDVYAITRYAEVKAALEDHGTFISGGDVGFDPELNQIIRGAKLVSDPPERDLLRSGVETRPNTRAIRGRSEEVAQKARTLSRTLFPEGRSTV